MHYRNGREAKNGDMVVHLGTDDAKVRAVGILFNAVPGNDFCNGSLAPISSVGSVMGACLCDCLHVDDVGDILKEKGLAQRPAAK